MKSVLLALSFFLPFVVSTILQEDDVPVDEHQKSVGNYEILKENEKRNIERLWKIPDTSVIVGDVFEMRILKKAFSGSVDHLEAGGTNGQSLPHWLVWNETASTLVGIPSKDDFGIHHIFIKAVGKDGDVAQDVFSITVVADNEDIIVAHSDEKPTDREPPTTIQPSTTPSTTSPVKTTTTIIPAPVPTTPIPITIPVVLPVEITKTIERVQKNFAPSRDRILKKQLVTAGKPISFVIPDDIFTDMEDGNTRQLSLSLYWQRNKLEPGHWLQFDKKTQKLEDAVSKWNYELVAQDSEGLNATAILGIYVRQHRLSRAVNHEFSIYLEIEKGSEFPTNVDWQIRVVRGLAGLYGNRNTDQITVRAIDVVGDQVRFTWFNDSLSRSNPCPKQQIDRLFRVLVANEEGDPSIALQDILAPEIKVKRVVYQGLQQCEDFELPITANVVTQEPKKNQPPVPRNTVDFISAIVGQLLVFTVPEDTFFDLEDGSTRNMKLSLMTANRSPIPESYWLQFDSKNQQFYGVPLKEDIGRTEYQLIVEDKGGESITDGLIVLVRSSPTSSSQHNVEFSITLDIPYNSFAHSATQKRKFIEKIGELFHDNDASAISLESITDIKVERMENTVVTWHNKTLVTSHCPDKEITQLREVLVKDDKMLTDRVEQVMGAEFPVKQISLTPTELCLGEMPSVFSPSVIPPAEDSTSVGKSHDDLIITYIVPAIIIIKKRNKNMSSSEQDDVRQSFKNQGIPVTFQDVLDEKPDSDSKFNLMQFWRWELTRRVGFLKNNSSVHPLPAHQTTEGGTDVPMLRSEYFGEPYQSASPVDTTRDDNRHL